MGRFWIPALLWLAVSGTTVVSSPPPSSEEPMFLERTVPSGGGEAYRHFRGVRGSTPPPHRYAPLTSFGFGPGFLAYDFDQNGVETGSLFIPPDPMGAAGPDRLIAVVNKGIEARDKSGTLLWRDSLKDFFSPLDGGSPGTLGSFTFDPKIVFDSYEDRFVVVTLEQLDTALGDSVDASRILLAVSQDSSPATATATDWHYHSIDAKILIGGIPHWVDYPGLEVDEEAVYVTANMFNFDSYAASFGVRLWIVDKTGFYDGTTAGVTVHDPYDGTAAEGFEGTTMPAQVFGSGGVGPGIGTFLLSYSGLTIGGPTGQEALNVIRVDDPLGPSGPDFTQEFVFVGNLEDIGGVFGFPELPDAPQSTVPELIEVNDRRALDAVWRDGYLWMTTTMNPSPATDPVNAGQTTARWIRLDATLVTSSSSGPGLVVHDQGGNLGGEDIAANAFTFYPAVAVNEAGEAKFGFSASAATIFAGAYFAGRGPADPPGTVGATGTVQAGLDAYERTFSGSRNRWGDYSGIALDPSDDRIFWVFNEYAEMRGTPLDSEDGRWGTAWRACASDSCVFNLPPVAVCEDVKIFLGEPDSCLAHVTPQDIDDGSYDPEGGALGLSLEPAGPYPAGFNAVLLIVTDGCGDADTCQATVFVDCPIPVRLDRVSLERRREGVSLQWVVGEGEGQVHFAVHREHDGERRQVSEILEGESQFSFLDTGAPGTEIRYWLRELERDAGNAWHGPFLAGAEVTVVPLTVEAILPNPSSSPVRIRLALERSGRVTVGVFDVTGRRIRELENRMMPPGQSEVFWDGRTGSGTRAPAGTYWVRVRGGGQTLTRSVVLIP